MPYLKIIQGVSSAIILGAGALEGYKTMKKEDEYETKKDYNAKQIAICGKSILTIGAIYAIDYSFKIIDNFLI